MSASEISISQKDLNMLILEEGNKNSTKILADFFAQVQDNIKKNTALAGDIPLEEIKSCNVTQEEVDSLFNE